MAKNIKPQEQSWPTVKPLSNIEPNTIYVAKLPNGDLLHLAWSGNNALTAIIEGTKSFLQVDAAHVWQFANCGK